ncbi:MAG: SRPBCC family protein [Mycobacteriales bacterium]
MPFSLSRTVDVDAPAERVWELVSDLPRMGELSPENTGGRWIGGATGPAVGARFKGTNRSGWRRWSTTVEVVRCEPGSAFAFDVVAGPMRVASWAYDVTATGPSSCTVTESWADRRGGLLKAFGGAATGVSDREAFTATSMEQTLAALKAAAERP